MDHAANRQDRGRKLRLLFIMQRIMMIMIITMYNEDHAYLYNALITFYYNILRKVNVREEKQRKRRITSS